MRRHRRPLLALVVAVGLIGGPVGPITAQNRPKVAYIYVGPVGDAGWTFQHDQARKYLEQTLGADTKFVESVPETAEVTRVLEQFISEGYKTIFATAFGYQTFNLEAAKKHPDAHIIGIGPAIGLAPNVKTIYGRIWEGRYLTGIVAGEQTDANIIRFVPPPPLSPAGAGGAALPPWASA